MADKKSDGIYRYLAAFAIVAIFAILVFTAIPQAGAGAESAVGMASAVNSVLIYSNGMAFVSSSGKAEVPSAGNTHLRIANFTEGAILDTLRVEDADGSVHWVKRYDEERNTSEKSERYLTFDELLNQSYGKEVVMRLESGETAGKLLWVSGGKIGIETQEGLLVVDGGLKNVLMNASETKKTEEKNGTVRERGLEVYMGANRAGAHDLLFSYMTSGANWQPNYNLEMAGAASGSARLAAFGEVSNYAGEDWRNVVLRLAVGQPNFVRNGAAQYYNYDFSGDARKEIALAGGQAPSAAPVFSGEEAGMQYVYTLSEPATILKNERANLKIFESGIQYEKENLWEGYGPVRRMLNLRNTLGKPIAAGIMKVFESGAFAGEGYVQYTGEGKEAHVNYAPLQQVEIKKETNQTTEKPAADRREITYSVSMAIENSLKEPAPVTLRDSMNYGDKVELVESSAPAARLSDNRLEWKVVVPAGGKLVVAYSYKATYFEQPVYYGNAVAGAAYPVDARE
ncbi:MAG: DUF4139 domain-containing protein [Candidatus Micrarchaeia archaeon]